MALRNELISEFGRGVMATVPLTVVMSFMRDRVPGPPRRLPPEIIAERVARRFGYDRSLKGIPGRAYFWASHLVYGGLSALPYHYVRRNRRPGFLRGVAYGASVWAVSYYGWLPAARLLKTPGARSPKFEWMTFLPHLVWGAFMGVPLAGRRRKPQLRIVPTSGAPERDVVDEASMESFPASDPPAW